MDQWLLLRHREVTYLSTNNVLYRKGTHKVRPGGSSLVLGAPLDQLIALVLGHRSNY